MAAPTPRLFPVLIFGLALALLALLEPQPAFSHEAASARKDITSSLGDQPQAPASPETHELESGNVVATVTVLRNGSHFPAGGSAFARIELTNTAPARTDAQLLLEAETAIIQNVSGKSVEVTDGTRTRLANIRKLSKGKPRTVVVELVLKSGESATDVTAIRNGLNITLRAPGADDETASLDWSVKNCASAYYEEIVKVREGSGSGIANALEAARKRDRSRPGRWLFPPRTARAPRGKCLRSVKRWSRSRGRYIYICTKRQTVKAAGAVKSVDYEGSVYRFAARLVRGRARDRELMPTRDSGWATTRVAKNLQYYLEQKPNPAICTGPIKMFDYFSERLRGFAKRAEQYDEMAHKSMELAELRTREAVNAARDESPGHPGWGSAPLDLPKGEGKTPLKTMIGNLAQITGDASLGQNVSNAGNAFSALKEMSKYFKGNTSALAAPVRTSMRRALGAIEAADYIGAVAGHYSDLRHALTGSTMTLRQAHARHCTCGG